MLSGFKQFILRGNVIDMAVGVVIGAAFGGVVTALTKDLLTPLIAALVGKPDFLVDQLYRRQHGVSRGRLHQHCGFVSADCGSRLFLCSDPDQRPGHSHAQGPSAR